MALDLCMKNGFQAISFEYIGVLDSYFIHRYIIIKYRSSLIMDKIHLFVVVVVDSSANITLAVSTWCFFELCFL